MDALTLLKNDHDAVKHLFSRLEKANGQQAQKLFDQLHDMLVLHEEMEETHFYPRLKEDSRAEELILESYQEHHVMDVLLGELRTLDPSAEEWDPKITVLQENTEHHIEEEEGELFPKVRKIWDTETRSEVGQQMQRMKDEHRKERRAA